ncbi:CDP-diacylglycerol--glycerol-3-phosphate 3-phosphatidyltransferase [Echinimonas agarilytica]|nr:CDP-diacylglycerol--glycerol-3-phosphate 3-phosphatidyltransferase [Echinimonas agarilytica]
MYTLPNILTLFRIGLIPVFLLAFYLPLENSHFWATLVFFIASMTDMLDGYLARRLEQTSPLGAFLDPVADKIIVAVALVLVAVDFNEIWITVPAMIIISREIVISALREWMASIGKSAQVAVGQIGKIKTTAQMLCLGGLVWQQSEFMIWLAVALLYVAAALTIWSMVIYLSSAWKYLEQKDIN